MQGTWTKINLASSRDQPYREGWGVRLDHYSGGAPNCAGQRVTVVTRAGKRTEVTLGGRVEKRSYCSIYRVAR